MSAPTAINWSKVPLGPGVAVLEKYDSGLVALNKPAGVLSHPNRAGDPAKRDRALVVAPYDDAQQCYDWTDAGDRLRRIWLLHRLDAATSGVILVATDEQLAAVVLRAFEERQVHKRYVAIVLGHPREKRALWRDRLEVRREAETVRAHSGRETGAPAETAMRCLRLIPGPPALAALELEPHTGRTHQLRLQCAKRRLPILGDQTYGNFKLNRDLARRFSTDRLFLHARSVELELPSPAGTRPRGGGVTFHAEAPLPPEFRMLIG